MACRELPQVLVEKRVYVVFDLAKNASVFSGKMRACFNEMNAAYGLLSEHVHTATPLHMSRLNAMAHFSTFDEIIASKATKYFVDVATNMLTVLSLNLTEIIHGMHHRNRETILEGLPKAIRGIVNANVELT
jgi:hypothetical protein